MKRLKVKELLNLSMEELDKRIIELKSEYHRLIGLSRRGLLKKETGSIKSIRRNIARLETAKRLKQLNLVKGEKVK